MAGTATAVANPNPNAMTRIWVLCFLMTVLACQSEPGIRADQDMAEGWQDPVSFLLPQQSTGRYDLYIHLRNDNNYPYANIYLIARLKSDSLTLLTDTLEYAMAAPNGKWLGSGFAEVKESKLYWRENIQLQDSLVYEIEIEHAQRAQGQIQGHKNLPGIVSVGYSLAPKSE